MKTVTVAFMACALLGACAQPSPALSQIEAPKPLACNNTQLEVDINWCLNEPCGGNRDRCDGQGEMQESIGLDDSDKFAHGFYQCQDHNIPSSAIANFAQCRAEDRNKPIAVGRRIWRH